MRTLSLAGIGSILDVAKASPSQIESLLGRNPPVRISYAFTPSRCILTIFVSPQFGTALIKNAKRFPVLDFKVDILKVDILAKRGVQVKLSVAVSLHSKDSVLLHRREAGLAIAAGILVLTSDHEYIDFRRIPYVYFEVVGCIVAADFIHAPG